MAQIALRGRGEIFSIYRVKNDLAIDTSKYNLSSKKDQELLYERVQERIESGEIDAISPSLQMRVLFQDDVIVEIEGEDFDLDTITLETQDLQELFANLEDIYDGEIIYLRREVGEGEFVFESEKEEINPGEVSLSYIDCSSYIDVLQEDINAILCDSINIDSLKIIDEEVEESEGYFDPVNVIDDLYVVRYDQESNLYLLERLSVGGTKLFDNECYVDDFDKN